MRFIVTGGGTGGHINPALSIAKYFMTKEEDSQVLYVGTEYGLEKSLVPKEGIDIKFIDAKGFKRKITPENLMIAYKAFKAVGESKKIIKEFNPQIVIGTGGYVCGPVLKAACDLKIPTIIHEQNVFPGMTVKMLANKVDICATSFDTTENYIKKSKRVVLTGNPVRSDLNEASSYTAKLQLGFDPRPVVFIMGGSLGAGSINNALIEMLEKGCTNDYSILASTGERNYDDVMTKIKELKIEIPSNVKIEPYIFNTSLAFGAADLVVCRTGAITISELAAARKPAIVIPSPNVANNHQEYNARYLSDKGAAVMINDSELDGLLLDENIRSLIFDSEKLQDMSRIARSTAMTNACESIYKCACELVYGKKPKKHEPDFLKEEYLRGNEEPKA